MAIGDLVIPDGFGNAVLKWQVTGRANPLSSTLGYSPATTSIDPAAHAEEIFTAFSQSAGICAAGAMNSRFQFTGVDCTYNNSGVMVGGSSSHAAITGTATEPNTMIVGNSWVFQKKTGIIGRHYRGRMFIPYMIGDEATIDWLGNINSANVLQGQTAMDSVYTALGAGTIGIIPNLLHHVPATGSAPVPTPITHFVALGKVGTQRRRLR